MRDRILIINLDYNSTLSIYCDSELEFSIVEPIVMWPRLNKQPVIDIFI